MNRKRLHSLHGTFCEILQTTTVEDVETRQGNSHTYGHTWILRSYIHSPTYERRDASAKPEAEASSPPGKERGSATRVYTVPGI